MWTQEDAKRRAATTYNAASDCYDDPANSFWERFGQRTVERLELSPVARVLDVCCGSGASAIPAAEAVGSGGFVLGVDLAENLLELARTKARQRGLKNLDFRAGDMLNLGLPESSFDAVVCVFGIFFVPDMHVARTRAVAARPPWGPTRYHNLGPKILRACKHRVLGLHPRGQTRPLQGLQPVGSHLGARRRALTLCRGRRR